MRKVTRRGRWTKKIIVLLWLWGVANISLTAGRYFDLETAAGNSLEAGSVDMSISSSGGNFAPNPDQMTAGSSVTRDATISNDGTLEFLYDGQYSYLSGDSALCNTLELTVVRNGTETLYSGILSSFGGFSAPAALISGGSDQLAFTLALPIGADPALSVKTCQFNFDFSAQQIGLLPPQGFHDEETLTGNDLGTIDFQAPPAPDIYQYENNEFLNSAGLTQCWQIVSDPQMLHNPVTFEYQDYSDSGYTVLVNSGSYTEAGDSGICGGFGQSILRDMSAAPDREVYWRVRAIDTVGNAGSWTTAHFTIDNTTPITSLSISNSPARPITETVVNGGFEQVVNIGGVDKPQFWNYEGDVEVVNNEYGASPVAGSKMVKIGRSVDPGNDIYFNSISQDIPNSAKNISFWYNFFTFDSLGYDTPGFSVFINDQMVYQIWAADIAGAGSPNNSGWRHFFFDISHIDNTANPILTLVFYSGNTGDDELQSWVYVDEVSTNPVVVNSSAAFNLAHADAHPNVTSYYQIGENGTAIPGSSFQLSSAPDQNIIYYWSVDAAGNEEAHHPLPIIYDNDSPDSIIDLTVDDVSDGDFILHWTAPNPNDNILGNLTASQYQVRFSTAPIVDDPSFNSATATSSASPRTAGETETLEITGLTPHIQYYFAVKTADAAPNWSPLDPLGGSVAASGLTVTLNEFLPDPAGDDEAIKPAGEWVELYNNAAYSVDVSGWALYDSYNSHELIISTANSDNNGNPLDAGETIIPSHGFLIVYRDGDSDFSLNNSGGDSVRLFHQPISGSGILIDSYTYAGDATTGKTFARIPDGTGPWIDPLPTPLGENTNLQGNYIIGQHEPDELEIVSTPTPTPATEITPASTITPAPLIEVTPTVTPEPTITLEPVIEPTITPPAEAPELHPESDQGTT